MDGGAIRLLIRFKLGLLVLEATPSPQNYETLFSLDCIRSYRQSSTSKVAYDKKSFFVGAVMMSIVGRIFVRD